MFQIKDFTSIAASILNYAKAVQSSITDFSVGSVARTMLEAPAVEMEELYQQMFIGLREAIPVAIYNSFDFSRIAALPSTGIIRVTITPSASDTLIAAGATFTTDAYPVKFISQFDATITAGNTYADVTVAADTAGAIGNVAASTAFTAYPSVQNIVSALALSSFNSGRDEETDDQRKARFAFFIATLNRGTIYALRYGFSLVNLKDVNGNVTEAVKFVSIVEPWLTDPGQPIGLVNCYLHNGTSGASNELLAEADKVIFGYIQDDGTIVSGWKAAGVKVVNYAASTVSQTINCTITVDPDYIAYDVQVAVQSAIANYINSLDIGGDVLRAEIIAAAMGIDGVINFVLATPANDAAMSNTQKAMMGSFIPVIV